MSSFDASSSSPTPGSRRGFLKAAGATGAFAAFGVWSQSTRTLAEETKNPVERPLAGCIGNGGMGSGDANAISKFATVAALADVDRNRSEALREKLKAKGADVYEDYRKILDRKDISLITISTPDHWHTKIAVDALRAGKDVYCQKPLTLTIAEGQLLRKVVAETGRTLQVGTQQRSDLKFLQAVALARLGRIGKIHKVTVAIGGSAGGGKHFEKKDVPQGLNWDLWQGQTAKTDYIPERCHNNFRWWYEYSGGKLTDWGAHHVDIGQWAIGMESSGPTSLEVVSVEHPYPLKNGYPTVTDAYNCATKFAVRVQFPNGVEMMIRDKAEDLGFDNGVMFEGEKGRFFVNRGKLTGEAVEALKENPIPEDELARLRKGQPADSHMGNFVRAVQEKKPTLSDVDSHHRILTTCHLANIALRLGRKITWDAQAETIVGDEEAKSFQSREQRKGFEIS